MTQERPPADPHDTLVSDDNPGAAAPSHRPEAVQTLRRAMRRARFDDAERVGVTSQHRVAQIGRLEALQDALRPLMDEIPRNAADMFDIGLMPGATPRLFIDMIGFVEMGRDGRLYRLLQDTRYRRLTVAETSEIGTMVEAITDYVARRLIERDKALAADTTEPRSRARPARGARSSRQPEPRRETRPRRGLRRVTGWIGAAFEFVIFLLGAIAFFGLLGAAAYYGWAHLQGQL